MDSPQALFALVLTEVTKIFYSRQWTALVLVPKLSGSISFVASTFVARDIIKTDSKSAPNRIVFCLSISDMMRSLFMDFIGTWMAPAGVAYGSAGTIQTCTAQGFLANFLGASAYLYNTSLAICYVLVICFRLRGRGLTNASHYLLIAPVMIALALAVPPLFSDSYNYTGGWSCHVAPAPVLCDRPDIPYPCERGGIPDGTTALNLQLWTLIVPSFSCGVIILLCMAALFLETLRRNRASGRYADFQRSRHNQRQTLRVAIQGIFYSLAYFLSVIFYYVIMIMFLTNNASDPPYWLHMLNAIFLPLQGLFNALVYIRPRYLRRDETSTSHVGTSACSSPKDSNPQPFPGQQIECVDVENKSEKCDKGCRSKALGSTGTMITVETNEGESEEFMA